MNIQVLVVDPEKGPYVKEVENDLESAQEIVGGYIEAIELEKGYILICNEEGIRLRLPSNFHFKDGELLGTCFFTKKDVLGDLISLDDEEVKYLQQKYLKEE
jgi:hypothetical protein